VYSASNRNEYQKQKNNVSLSKALPARRVDNLTAICEPDAGIFFLTLVKKFVKKHSAVSV
jgi:hypothetical protein